jgi:hypothetical protein
MNFEGNDLPENKSEKLDPEQFLLAKLEMQMHLAMRLAKDEQGEEEIEQIESGESIVEFHKKDKTFRKKMDKEMEKWADEELSGEVNRSGKFREIIKKDPDLVTRFANSPEDRESILEKIEELMSNN